jgi:hypothetical protein
VESNWDLEQELIRCRPDFTNTEPAANIGPFPQWADKKKIVSMDPLGHLAPWLFKDIIEKENGGGSSPRILCMANPSQLILDQQLVCLVSRTL